MTKDIKQEIRHLGTLIETVNDNVKLVAEQHNGIKKEIHSVKQTLNSHTEMIGKIAVDLAIVKQDGEFIKNSLKQKVDIDEFVALERRVALLENHR